MKILRATQSTIPETSPSSDSLIRIAFSPVYKYELPPGHRFPMEKYELVTEQLLYEGTVESGQFFHPEQMKYEYLKLTHTEEYLQKLDEVALDRREIRDIGFPLRKALIERGKHIAQGTLDCAYYALYNSVALNIAGGTHHAFADHGEGFCVFNDIALAANVLLNEHIVNKILIIDLDVHQGNGTAKIFENESRVFTFSMHGERNYPLRKTKSDLDIGLQDGLEDRDYLEILNDNLDILLDRETPELVFYLSGVDILATDKLGRLSVSKSGCKERDQKVLKACKIRSIPVAVSMGGGYSVRVADVVDAHANTFRVAKEIFEGE